MAEITVTCGEHTHHVRLTQREMSFILRRQRQQCAVLSSTSFSFQASEVTYHEFITRFELRLDFSADIAVGDAQVLPDVAVVAHQGHVVLVDVEQLRRRQQRFQSIQLCVLCDDTQSEVKSFQLLVNYAAPTSASLIELSFL